MQLILSVSFVTGPSSRIPDIVSRLGKLQKESDLYIDMHILMLLKYVMQNFHFKQNDRWKEEPGKHPAKPVHEFFPNQCLI
jgi:hypothetical protein